MSAFDLRNPKWIASDSNAELREMRQELGKVASALVPYKSEVPVLDREALSEIGERFNDALQTTTESARYENERLLERLSDTSDSIGAMSSDIVDGLCDVGSNIDNLREATEFYGQGTVFGLKVLADEARKRGRTLEEIKGVLGFALAALNKNLEDAVDIGRSVFSVQLQKSLEYAIHTQNYGRYARLYRTNLVDARIIRTSIYPAFLRSIVLDTSANYYARLYAIIELGELQSGADALVIARDRGTDSERTFAIHSLGKFGIAIGAAVKKTETVASLKQGYASGLSLSLENLLIYVADVYGPAVYLKICRELSSNSSVTTETLLTLANSSVRSHRLYALLELGERKACPELLLERTNCASDAQERQFARRALDNFKGGTEFVSTLEKRFSNSDTIVRFMAIRAMVKLLSYNSTRDRASTALVKLGKDFFSECAQLTKVSDPEIRQNTLTAVARLLERGVVPPEPLLEDCLKLATIDPDLSIRRQAILVLGFAAEKGCDVGFAVVPLINLLAHSDIEIRKAVHKTIAKINPSMRSHVSGSTVNSISAALTNLLRGPNVVGRRMAAMVLGDLNYDNNVTHLLALSLADKDKQVRDLTRAALLQSTSSSYRRLSEMLSSMLYSHSFYVQTDVGPYVDLSTLTQRIQKFLAPGYTSSPFHRSKLAEDSCGVLLFEETVKAPKQTASRASGTIRVGRTNGTIRVGRG